MKLLIAGLLVLCPFAMAAPHGGLRVQGEPVEHSFVIHNFKTESGVVLPEAKIVYGTYGQLNAAGDNAILLPSHYMAKMNGYGWLMGPGKALDPEKSFW